MKATLKIHLTENPKASVLLLHGYAEHQGRYRHIIDHLVEHGYDVYSYDQYGHGTSPGPRARVDVGSLIKDHLTARRQVSSIMRTPDLFLFGHSLGGLVTAASNLIDPRGVRGVALSGPAFDSTGGMDPEIVSRTAKATLLLPDRTPTVKLDANKICSDPKVVEDYLNDPFNYTGKVPALTASTMLTQGLEVQRRAYTWQNPLIIFHGANDELCDPRASWHFVQQAQTNGARADLVEVPEAKHEVFNEPHVKGVLLETLTVWMDTILEQ